MPEGADTVMKFEDVRFTADTVTFTYPFGPRNVIAVGEDMQAGTLLVRHGDRLNGAALGLLAGQGIADVKVFRRPRVALLSNGEELVEPGSLRHGSQIYNSSNMLLMQYIRDCGAEPVYRGIVRDNEALLAARMAECLDDCDMLVITGGASVGDYDFCPRAAARIGAEMIFRKVNYRPGGSMFLAKKDGKLLLSLSGNPAAAAVTMLLLGQPALLRLCGRNDLSREVIEVALAEPFPAPHHPGAMNIIRGHLVILDGMARLVQNEGRGNGAVLSMRDCNLLGLVPAGSGPLRAGDRIRAVRV